MDAKKAVKALQKHMDAIAKERDRLDETISEFEDLRYKCEQAFEDLQRARDALSELV